MSKRLEPYQDQRTIGSFKRTVNAALLRYIAREDTARRRHPVALTSALGVVAGIAGSQVTELMSHLT